MIYIRMIIVVLVGALFITRVTLADTTVGEFEALNVDEQAEKLADLTNKVVDKIAEKKPIRALKIQEYFVIPPPGQKHAVGSTALYHQIAEYNQIDPNGYTIENAFAKVLSDYLVQNGVTTQPTTAPTTQSSSMK
jgi:hypothetical protein